MGFSEVTNLFCCPDSDITLSADVVVVSGNVVVATGGGDVVVVADGVIVVDHKPLLRTLEDRCLNDIPNGRLRNLKEKTLRYRFRIIHTPGIRNKVPDALSRYPSGPRHPDTMVLTLA